MSFIVVYMVHCALYYLNGILEDETGDNLHGEQFLDEKLGRIGNLELYDIFARLAIDAIPVVAQQTTELTSIDVEYI